MILATASTTFLSTLRRSLAAVLLLLLPFGAAFAQSTDGSTPSGLAPGAPAGTYSLGGFDQVNLFNGNLDFHLPLIAVNGRGAARTTVMLGLNLKKWRTKTRTINVGPDEPTVQSLPTPDAWSPHVGYGPGVLYGRQSGVGRICPSYPYSFSYTFTSLTFVMPDGTEIEFRDQLNDGRPIQTTTCPAPSTGASRGTVFLSTDGTAATFISDATIYDYNIPPSPQSQGRRISPSGNLLLRDGTRYRIDSGQVSWIRDRHGNKLTFTRDASGNLSVIKDSLNRQVNISYNVAEGGAYGTCDRLTYQGVGGAARVIRVCKTSMSNALRPGSGYTIKTYLQLFPELYAASNTTTYNPTVVSAVWLPDGDGITRRYDLYYNSYGELARVLLPTGGAIEYDMTPGSGVIGDGEYGYIYRRVVERRVYSHGATLEGKTVYTESHSGTNPPSTLTTTVVVDSLNPAGALVARQKHYYNGSAPNSLGRGAEYVYGAWKEGREYQTEDLDVNGTTVLRRSTATWQQRAPVAWWGAWVAAHPYLDPAMEPSNSPRLVETRTTLVDTNQVKRQTFSYDQFNNQKDVYEYDFGAGAPPAHPTRRLHTDYVTSNNGIDYTANGVHIRSLPRAQLVYAVNPSTGAQTLAAQSETRYDEVGYPPLTYAAVTGWEDPGTPARGSATTTRTWLDTTGGWFERHAQYDQTGNVRNAWDAKGILLQTEYADAYSDGLNRNTYALPTRTVSPVPDPTGQYGTSTALVTASTYDYSTGLTASTTDVNGQVSTFEYNDALDRPTKVNRPDGGWSSFTYNRSVSAGMTSDYVRTLISLDATRSIDIYQFFDGLGRPNRTFLNEGGSPAVFSTTDTQYDPLGRPWRVSSLYRTSGSAAAVNPSGRWTESTFDALGRVTRVKVTADNSSATTSYSGNQVTATDQSGKSTRSVTDGLGRLSQVVSDPNGLAYATNYTYDAVGNLRKVEQGGQVRFFMYDSLSRLIRAKNPEHSANAALALTDPVTGNAQWSNSYGYDANGNLTSRTDARNVSAAYTYDRLNRNTYVSYSDSTPHVKRVYDTAANGLGRERGRWTASAAGVHYTHTAVDSYDAQGRPLTQRQHFYAGGVAGPAFTTQRTYDRAGNVRTQSYPSGRTVTYTYDAAGRLASFAGNLGDAVQRTYTSGISYDVVGGIREERFGTDTPVYKKRFYNVRGQLAEVRVSTQSITAADPGHWNRGAILNVYSGLAGWTESGTDNNGNLRKQMIFVPNDDAISGWWETALFYDYDALNRLYQSREVRGGVNHWVQYFNYDRWGNRTINAASTTNAPEPQFAVDTATNRLGVPAGLVGVMSYDPAGNLTTDSYTGGGTRAFDAEGRMTTAQFVSGQLQTAAYTYDADGRRVKRGMGAGGEVWQVNGMDGELLAEYAASASPAAPLKEYGYRAGELLVTAEPGAQVRWLVSDQLGTPRMVLDRTGALAGVKRHDYYAFGEEIPADASGRTGPRGYAADGVRQKFTAYERDNETGLDFAQARYYSSTMGRFTSPDNFLNDSNPSDPGSWNLYAYARNNPLKFIDPSGEIVDGSHLTPEQRQQIIQELARLTGYSEQDIYFDPQTNLLTVSPNAVANGGSATARRLVNESINSSWVFQLEAVGTRDVAFAQHVPTLRAPIVRADGSMRSGGVFGRVNIDFGDFGNLVADDEATRQAFSMGIALLHEFVHGLYPNLQDGASTTNPGDLENLWINPIRRELGMPLRAGYAAAPVSEQRGRELSLDRGVQLPFRREIVVGSQGPTMRNPPPERRIPVTTHIYWSRNTVGPR